MSDQTVESTGNVSGVVAQPAQTQSGASQVSAPSLDVNAIAAKVAEILKPEFQSVKDKRISKLEEAIKELVAPQTGQQTQPAQTEPAKTEPATTQVAQVTPATRPETGTQQVVTEAEKTILTSLGLAADDVAVTSVQGDFQSRVIEYTKIAERRKQPSNPAAVSTQTGGTPASAEALTSELLRLQDSDPMDKNGRQAQIKTQLGWH